MVTLGSNVSLCTKNPTLYFTVMENKHLANFLPQVSKEVDWLWIVLCALTGIQFAAPPQAAKYLGLSLFTIMAARQEKACTEEDSEKNFIDTILALL